jgi:hypothetical protein
MPSGRFPSPWSIEELDACFIVKDSSGQKLGYEWKINKRYDGISAWPAIAVHGLRRRFSLWPYPGGCPHEADAALICGLTASRRLSLSKCGLASEMTKVDRRVF